MSEQTRARSTWSATDGSPHGTMPVNNTDVWIGRWPTLPALRVCWHTSARFEILSHCLASPDVETGGVFLGHVLRAHESVGAENQVVDSVEILDAIEVGHASAGENRLNFSPSVWAEINRVHDRECPDLEIVGWYHSHPGWGVALSSDDLPIQNNHFAEKLALVIDTHKRRGAFFAGSGKKGGPFKSEEFVWDQQAVQVMMDMRSASPLADRGRERSALSSREGGHDTSPDIRIIEDELPPGGIDPDVWAGARDAVPEDASTPRRQLVTGRDVLAFLLGMVALVVAQWGGIPLVKYVASVLLSASLEQVLIIAAIAVFLVLIVIFLLFKSGLGRHNEIGE